MSFEEVHQIGITGPEGVSTVFGIELRSARRLIQSWQEVGESISTMLCVFGTRPLRPPGYNAAECREAAGRI
jgi:hypothetical protein